MEKMDIKWGSIFLLIIGLVMLAVAWFTGGVTINEDNYISLSDNWNLQINDEAYEHINLDELSFPTVGKGDVLVLHCTLPEASIASPELEFFTVHSVIKAYLGDELIYTYGEDLYESGSLLGYGYHLIDLPDDYMGQSLEIQLTVSENDAFSSIDTPRIYNGKYYLRDYLYTNRIPLIISIFLTIFGICVGVLSGVCVFTGAKMLQLFCASMFSFCIGMWSLSNYSLLVIFTENLLVKTFIEYASLYLAPFFIFLYFKDDAMRKDRAKGLKYSYWIVLGLQAAFSIISIFGQCLNLIHLPQMLRVQHVLMLAIALWVLSMFIADIIHRKLRHFTLFYGALIMAFFAMFDLFHFYIQKYIPFFNGNGYHGIVCIGTLIFAMSLIIHYLEEIREALYVSAEQEALSRLAYTDALTGLANRRKCEDLFDELDESEHDYALIEFDLNNLKKVNDTLGHEMGDAFITAFGQCLSKTFGQHGLVGRTGGDEFLVIIKNADEIDINGAINKLHEEIAAENEKHPQWNMSTAYGICRYSVDRLSPVRHAYKVADARMYEHKMEMKRKLGMTSYR